MAEPKKAEKKANKLPQVGMSPEHHRKLRHYAADHQCNLKEAVEKAVELLVTGGVR